MTQKQWNISYCDTQPHSIHEEGDEGAVIAHIRGWGHLTGTGGGLGLPPEQALKIQQERAHLIAAAPDTLEALQEFIRVTDYVPEISERLGTGDGARLAYAREQAIVAIAKAQPEGE